MSVDNEDNIYKSIEDKLNASDFIVNYNKKKSKKILKIDDILLNKYLGLPIFLIIILGILGLSFFCGQNCSKFIESIISYVLEYISKIYLLNNLVNNSFFNCFITTIESILECSSLIFFLHFFLLLLEESGYISRGVFLIDKTMKKIGLNGGSFIPLITNFGCNVPGILATRTLKNRTVKLITILISPMISCPAKLPVYVMLSGLFLTGFKQSLFILTIYLTGIFMAFLFSKLLSNFFLSNNNNLFIIDIPEYCFPNIKNIFNISFSKMKHFIKTIGPFIIIFSFLIWFLQNYHKNNKIDVIKKQNIENDKIIEVKKNENNIDNENNNNENINDKNNKTINKDNIKDNINNDNNNINEDDDYKDKYIYIISKFIEPIFKPLGFNWKMDIALIGGIFAKESIPSILRTMYPNTDNNSNVKSNFNLPVTISFIFFILFYCPCINTILAIFNEIGLFFTIFILLFYTMFSFGFSFLMYKIFSFFYF